MTYREALNRIIEIKALEKKADKLNEEIKNRNNVLKEWMEQGHYQELTLCGYKLSCRKKIKDVFDIEAFKAEYNGLYEMYLIPTESTHFSITR